MGRLTASETPRKLDIRAEQQNERRDQQLSARYAKQSSHNPNNECRDDARDYLRGSRQYRRRVALSWPITRTMAISSSMIAMTRYRVCEASFVAHPAPNHAPSKLPASRFDDHRPMRGDRRERHRCRSKRESGGDDDQAHGLVQDHRLQGSELERADFEPKASHFFAFEPAELDEEWSRNVDAPGSRNIRVFRGERHVGDEAADERCGCDD